MKPAAANAPQGGKPMDSIRRDLLQALVQVISAGELLTNRSPPALIERDEGELSCLLLDCSNVLVHLRHAWQPDECGTAPEGILSNLCERHLGLAQAAASLSPLHQQLFASLARFCELAPGLIAVLRSTPPGAFASPAGQSLLLIVDDEPGNIELLARRLQRDNHAVLTAESGRQALRMLSRYAVDLVLLDLQMPGMSGVETLREIRITNRLTYVPVIMITAEDDIQVIASCITSGADDYLVKPPQPVLLRARLNALLSRKHLQDEQRRQQLELERASQDLREQAEKMEQLLEHILPKSIASELQQSGSVQPMYFEDVSIVFADIVGFTLSTENLPADDLVESLHEYFTACDEIVARRGLEKMKTIGDSYMFAGGMPQHNSSHPVDSIFASLEMIAALQEISRARSLPWKLRVGMHVGPVIAGVVGIHKFAFDIWGEAVNAASRVEACGGPNQVNLSSAAYLRVKDFFACETREQVRNKDGRHCDMYFVKGIAAGLRLKPPLTPGDAFQVRYAKYFRKPLSSLPECLLHEDGLALQS